MLTLLPSDSKCAISSARFALTVHGVMVNDLPRYNTDIAVMKRNAGPRFASCMLTSNAGATSSE
jgi:hypothetical protein